MSDMAKWYKYWDGHPHEDLHDGEFSPQPTEQVMLLMALKQLKEYSDNEIVEADGEWFNISEVMRVLEIKIEEVEDGKETD